jgi:putative hemolysin
VLARLGQIPQTGDHFLWDGLRFEIVDMDGRRIDRILVGPDPAQPAVSASEYVD